MRTVPNLGKLVLTLTWSLTYAVILDVHFLHQQSKKKTKRYTKPNVENKRIYTWNIEDLLAQWAQVINLRSTSRFFASLSQEVAEADD